MSISKKRTTMSQHDIPAPPLEWRGIAHACVTGTCVTLIFITCLVTGEAGRWLEGVAVTLALLGAWLALTAAIETIPTRHTTNKETER